MGLLFQEHYPERMSRCFVINAPGFFNVLWRCVKTLHTPPVKLATRPCPPVVVWDELRWCSVINAPGLFNALWRCGSCTNERSN